MLFFNLFFAKTVRLEPINIFKQITFNIGNEFII